MSLEPGVGVLDFDPVLTGFNSGFENWTRIGSKFGSSYNFGLEFGLSYNWGNEGWDLRGFVFFFFLIFKCSLDWVWLFDSDLIRTGPKPISF